MPGPKEPKIIAETFDWLVVDKPPGWLSIPGRAPQTAGAGSSSGAPLPVLHDWVRGLAPGALVVHRLDKETSGVILFAKSPESHRRAGIWFQNHEVRKIYDCLAQGKPRLPVFRVDEPIEGLASRTQFEVRARYGEAVFLAHATPLSGRRHQIRKHLASQGHSILGDVEYGGLRDCLGVHFQRVALHARALELPSGERFEAAWPEDWNEWIRQLEGSPR